MAARTSRLHDATAFERTVDCRYRHHGEAALWASGRRGGELQSSQAGSPVAQLSLLHDGQPAAGAGGGRCAWQPAYFQAFLAPPVGVPGWPAGRPAAWLLRGDAGFGNEPVMRE